MTALNKPAYRADGGDIGTGRLKEIADNAYGDEEKRWLAQRVLALLDEMEAAERERDNWRNSFDNERFRADKLAEAFKTEHEQLVMANRALITQHVRANGAENRMAELEAKLANPVSLPKTNGYWNEQEKAYEEAITLARRQIRLAGFRCEGDE
ncbi:hypothetical protein [Citrobacter freundii complex sp. 2025EL-00176]